MIFPGALGDLVCFLPTLSKLAGEGPDVVLLCREDLVGLVREVEPVAAGGEGLPWVDEALPIESPPSGWLFSVDPPPEADRWYGSFHSVVSYTGSGHEQVRRNLRRWNGEVQPFRPVDRKHQAVHFLHTIGVAADFPPDFRVRPTGRCRPEVLRGRASLNERRRLIVHPGSGGARKRWCRDGFAALVSFAREHRWDVLVVLGPAERNEEPAWEAATGVRVVIPADAAGLAAVLAAADAYVGNDSGPSHLAAVLGLPGIVLFGPTDPGSWRPLSARFRIVRPTPWAKTDVRPDDDQILLVSQELGKLLSSVSA